MRAVGGDGFRLVHGDFDRRYVAEIRDGLVAELQRRRLGKPGDRHKTFRGNLIGF
ncbi:hypothetical protein GCM10011320_26960 [Neoroseomonas lacus]|uniref:Uncharacterized protein n=2 Tax=Neoroseomonas lacus TaxID=287609 RepID=A0A917NQA5_9PROT|nr:hypothetical protein GCM10011320_26960 [Neoroseomonas lacus]